MNLQAMTAGVVGLNNPSVPFQWRQSTGYGTDATGKQVPTYAAAVTLSGQFQALSGGDIKRLDSLNIQGVERALYAQGNIQGVNRDTKQGGDLINVGAGPTVTADLANTYWKVAVVLETWGTGWCKLGLVRQLAPPGP